MIRHARDFVTDVGESAAAKSGGLVALSRRSSRNGERDCHRLMAKQCRLALPIQKHYLPVAEKGPTIPFLRVRDWLQMMVDNNCSHILCGLVRPDRNREVAIWEQFWKNWEAQEPQHPIFAAARAGHRQLGRCVPLLLHGDEGRSKKRTPFLVLSVHSVLGRGVEVGLQNSTRKRRYIKQLPNFVGHSYTNRFLVSALPKVAFTGSNSYIFDVLLDSVAAELCQSANIGVTDRDGNQWWAYCLGVVGDWPWLAKCGLDRSFMNLPKHRDNGGGGVRAACRGICHLCQAGQPGVPYEEIGARSPQWVNTLLQQSPFPRPNPFRNLPCSPGENQLAKLFHFDLFHCWHLGLAKNYLGSMLALLSDLEGAGNVDTRFEEMSGKYLRWCRANRRPAHVAKLSKDSINWPSTTVYPTGAWHKGDLSTSLMLWVESRFLAEDWSGNDMLQLGGEACVAANSFLKKLYGAEAWLTPDEALQVSGLGFRFLRRYSQCALLAFQRNLRLWAIQPKAHACAHIFAALAEGARKGLTLNALCTSVQQDEDFIGRNSRLSRHVNQAHVAERVVDRYLQGVLFPNGSKQDTWSKLRDTDYISYIIKNRS